MRLVAAFSLICLSTYAQIRLVEIAPANPAEEAAVRALHLDDVCCHGDHVIIHSDAEMEALVATGVAHAVLQADLHAHYAGRLTPPIAPQGLNVLPTFGQGSMGGYFTNAEMITFLDGLVTSHPNVIAPKISLGTTIEGRDIWAWKISDNPTVDEAEPEVLIDGVHHAREPMSMHSILWMAKELCEGYGANPDFTGLVDEREIWIVPMVNPDGYVYNQTTNPNGGGLWRKNRRINGDGSVGVDLNRNYGFAWGLDNVGSSPSPSSQTYRGTGPFSEPETQAMKAFAESRNFVAGISNHSYSQFVFIPPGHQVNAFPPQPLRSRYEAFAAEMAPLGEGYLAGYPWDILYVANGTTSDWWYANLYGGQTMWSFGSEIGNANDGFWPPSTRIVPLAASTLDMLLYVVRLAGANLTLESPTVGELGGTVTGAWEPGETLEITAGVRNAGVTAGTTQLRLETTSPYLTVGNGMAPLGAVAPFGGTANNASSPLTLTVSPSAPVGAYVSFDVIADGAGAPPQRITLSMPVGLSPVTLASDDFEGTSTWSSGVPGDTAVTGQWVLADPNGTTLNGEVYNPEDDASAAGTQCWFTGQGTVGGSVGAQDVDGTTTLVSPIFDLANVENPVITWQEWFATTGDDALTVEISNDAGASWRPVRTTTGLRNTWTTRSITVEDWLPRTSAVQLRFVASDDPNDSICEAGLDDLSIDGVEQALTFTTQGDVPPGGVVTFDVNSAFHPGAPYGIAGSGSVASGLPVGDRLFPLVPDDLFLAINSFPTIWIDFLGTLDATGHADAFFAVPSIPALSGVVTWYSAVLLGGNADIVAISGGVRVEVL